MSTQPRTGNLTRNTTPPPVANQARQRQLLIIGGIIGVAVLAVIVVIALSGRTAASTIDFSDIPQTRGEDGAFVLGDPNAPITFIEFADFACPHCQEYHGTMTRLIEDYVATGQARFELRVFATTGGQLSRFAGNVLECAEEQRPGTYWPATEFLYTLAGTGRYTEDLGRAVATEYGLSYSELLNCTTSAEQINTDYNIAQAQEVTGTPAMRVRYGDGPITTATLNGRTYTGADITYDVITQLVNQANGV